MSITHRFFSELTALEEAQNFCGFRLEGAYRTLIIGTFNPDDICCLEPNDASWYYGRKKNWFWKYLPECMGHGSLHVSLGYTISDWKQYCIENRIVIVDLIKSIETNQLLESFADDVLDSRIKEDLSNVSLLNFKDAFKDIVFDQVIYSRKGWKSTKTHMIPSLIKIKEMTNNILLHNKNVISKDQIRYCPAPWQRRSTTQPQWCIAISNRLHSKNK